MVPTACRRNCRFHRWLRTSHRPETLYAVAPRFSAPNVVLGGGVGTVVLVEVLVGVELEGKVVVDVVVGLPVAGFTWRLSTLKVTGAASASPATAKPSVNEPAP